MSLKQLFVKARKLYGGSVCSRAGSREGPLPGGARAGKQCFCKGGWEFFFLVWFLCVCVCVCVSECLTVLVGFRSFREFGVLRLLVFQLWSCWVSGLFRLAAYGPLSCTNIIFIIVKMVSNTDLGAT